MIRRPPNLPRREQARGWRVWRNGEDGLQGTIMVDPLFWYAGGKRRVAPVVWRALGDPATYIEPFAGSSAVFLARPESQSGRLRVEVINDHSARLMNVYRAIRYAPDQVWEKAKGIRATVDMDARHRALRVANQSLSAVMRNDPEYYDATLAAWQLYTLRYSPHPSGAMRLDRNVLGRPAVNARTLVFEELLAVRDRFERNRVMLLCGPWSSACSSTLCGRSTVGVFLDPPYDVEDRHTALYERDSRTAARECRRWAVQHAHDPRFRIVLCGYDTEGCPPGWTEMEWTSGSPTANRRRERLWFSPHCLTDG